MGIFFSEYIHKYIHIYTERYRYIKYTHVCADTPLKCFAFVVVVVGSTIEMTSDLKGCIES